MPKRLNPFGETFSPQFKTHVGIKEVNMGVNWKDNMKFVHDKTQDLLFNGMKKQFSQLNSSVNSKFPSKQNNWLFLKSKEHSGLNNSMSNNPYKSLSCSFCDRTVTALNSCVCTSCNGKFCHLCSVLQYDKHEDTAICLTCLQK
ncbi:apoptosis regulatory protein Siva-like [Centruroides sculpturatus]|uniref:apoptosis regulatory protein Siva-like n=1 Tax=Centruroides sculpturatus TaxID=218467 RepID=UPI000C6EE2E5|nr:apoptosis regulatory protein Siva-like [Centruroides sculpturatus]